MGACAHAPRPLRLGRGGGGAGVGQMAGFARGQAFARARYSEPGVGGGEGNCSRCGWRTAQAPRAASGGRARGRAFFPFSFSSLAPCAGALLLPGPRGRLALGGAPRERERVGGGLFRP